MSIENTYKQLTQIEHILHRPDTYVGSLNKTTTDAYVMDPDTMQIVKRTVTYSPAFLKIFDEVLTNASDQCQKDGSRVTYIKVNVSEAGKISVENDGKSLPIEIHKELGCYVPEMTFTRLLTGSNFNDDEERFGAGRNGLGSKLANIYSSKFIIETCDGKKSYKQVCTENMNVIGEPEIGASNTSMTRISFHPEFHRFKMEGLERDALSLIIKRTLDVAAYNPGINVYFNNKAMTVKNFEQYVRLHVPDGEEVFIERLNDRFEIAVVKSNTGQFEQISIVNGVSTFEGGTHTYWASYQIANEVYNALAKGKRVKMRWQDVKNNMMLFMRAKVPNPSFPSQTKEKLATPMTKEILMGAAPSDKLLKKIQRSEIVEELLRQIDARDKADLSKMVKPVSNGRIKVEKLEDANKAGTRDATKCSLILCEGDSAKGMAVAGFSVVGRDYYGVFPLKGKVLNVRDAAADKIRDNAEIAKILTILGLVPGKKYRDLSELRYGKVIFMTDQDHDGTHIKGLLLNAFHFFWPELLKFDFIYEFITPIVKARKGKLVKSYYRLSDYVKDKPNLSGWSTKYYKGLGTSDAKESKEYFADLPKHLLPIKWDKDVDYSITKAFSNKLANLRKEWILNHVATDYDKFGIGQTITEFVDRELIDFSTADLNRSIPDVVDGLKPSTRKILYTFLDRNITKDEKVADVSGVISSKTAYHHGAGSLESSIVGMAQDFVGSNNLNLLVPAGMFGTRTQGGKDHASSRYVFSRLEDYTRYIFRPEDDDILDFLEDDGKQIEPERYYPIIPMVLVNGAAGIGTGWSTDIEKYDVKDVITILKKVLKAKSITKKMFELKPYYRGFMGTIVPSVNGHMTRGVYTVLKGNKVQVTELPVGMWTDNFIIHLDKLLDNKIKVGKGKEMKEVASPLIKSFVNNSTDDTVNVTVTLLDDPLKTNINKLLSLEELHATSNMHCFSEGKVSKYETAEDIFVDYFEQRLLAYEWRREMMLHLLAEKIARLKSIYDYVRLVIAKKVKVVGETLEYVEEQLEKNSVSRIEDSYGHLHRLQIQSVSTKRAGEIEQEYLQAEEELKRIQHTTVEDLWLSDLGELEKKLTVKK